MTKGRRNDQTYPVDVEFTAEEYERLEQMTSMSGQSRDLLIKKALFGKNGLEGRQRRKRRNKHLAKVTAAIQNVEM